MRVLVLGDVIDDIIVVPKNQLRPNTDTVAKISQTLGGSAGNIASWASYAGADVTFIGCVNEKDLARVTDQFALYGVKVNLQTSSKETGKLVSIVEGSSRTMLTDRAANFDLDFNLISDSYLEKFGFVFLSGYCIFEKEIADVVKFLGRVKDLGIKVMIDPGSAGFIRDYGISDFSKAISLADVYLPNEDEFELVGPVAKTTIVTKGEAGVDLYEHGELVESFEIQPIQAIDPTGAGDSFSGTVLAQLANDKSFREAINLAISNAAKAVLTIGARPQL
ncbi:MAG: carbohydrate kinase family protein [Microbacteriaceae bacterium]|nr:carbohydrate kinase family protein [Microbacteriaceae bacterium]